MRLISLGVMFSNSISVDQVVRTIEEHFPNYLPQKRIFRPPGSTHTLLFWEKITIGTNWNLNEKVLQIEKTIPNCRIFANELGEDSSRWKEWRHTIIGIIAATIGIIIGAILGT